MEGFLDKPLRKIAQEKGREVESVWRSLKLLHEILLGSTLSEEAAKQLLAPMKKLHELRNEIRGHATHEKKEVAIREARATHGKFSSSFFPYCRRLRPGSHWRAKSTRVRNGRLENSADWYVRSSRRVGR